jgi:MoaA/NifB/PqqE/SkfB family radical SAM enzyme
MSLATARKALTLFQGDYITLGGGEPTLHKRFWEIFGLAMGFAEDVWLATNGSIETIAVPLANMAKRGVCGVALSRDGYHDDIPVNVVMAFSRDKSMYGTNRSEQDRREIREVTERHIVKAGRATWGTDGCLCEDLFVKPDGTIHQCGCKDSPVVGHVNTGFSTNDYVSSECWKTQAEAEE